ncbi:hypothetical protein QYE76_041740 [Lolium multiflorum]|uniref:Uncharacterized protein n=1 Tax=Lolium multiflorum TaxID=4521 RepID=A0AAD8TFG2_LOLMU|nr:hypothetical protein QYE76_041740 [Lolium multiflorum]
MPNSEQQDREEREKELHLTRKLMNTSEGADDVGGGRKQRFICRGRSRGRERGVDFVLRLLYSLVDEIQHVEVELMVVMAVFGVAGDGGATTNPPTLAFTTSSAVRVPRTAEHSQHPPPPPLILRSAPDHLLRVSSAPPPTTSSASTCPRSSAAAADGSGGAYLPVSSTATVAAPAPAGPHSGGSKSVLDGEEPLLFTL